MIPCLANNPMPTTLDMTAPQEQLASSAYACTKPAGNIGTHKRRKESRPMRLLHSLLGLYRRNEWKIIFMLIIADITCEYMLMDMVPCEPDSDRLCVIGLITQISCFLAISMPAKHVRDFSDMLKGLFIAVFSYIAWFFISIIVIGLGQFIFGRTKAYVIGRIVFVGMILISRLIVTWCIAPRPDSR